MFHCVWILSKQGAEHLPEHIREPHVSALVAVAESLMVETKAVQHRCMKVVHAHGVFSDVVGEIIQVLKALGWWSRP